MRGLAIAGAVVSAAVWTYALLGPRGVLPRPKPEGRALPMPEVEVAEDGSRRARVDPAEWSMAFSASGLPMLPDPNGLELVPVQRLVEASRRWVATGEGDELGRMGEVVMALELHEAAIDYFVAARELGSQPERWAYFLGAEYQRIGASEAAVEALEAARALDPGYGTTSTRLGALYLDLGDLEEADAAYGRAAESEPAPSAGLVGRARVALERRDFEGALGFLEGALRLAPGDFIAHRLRSQALTGLGRTEEAAEAARVSNELPPYRGWLSFDPRLGEASEAAGTQRSLELAMNAALARRDLRAAAAAGEALLERLPESPQVHSVLAGIQANAGNTGRALELAQRAVELRPDDLQALRSLADIASSVGALEEGGRAAEAMVELAPDSAVAHQTLGRALFLQGRTDEAVGALRRAIRLEPRESRHRLLLVDVLQRTGRLEEARLDLQELLSIDPQNAEARQRLEGLRTQGQGR